MIVNKKSSQKICIKLVAIAKNEAPYIAHWVYHHFRVGIHLIELHINDTTDNSIEICKKIKKIYKEFSFTNGDKLLESCRTSGGNYQIAAYNKSFLDSLNGLDSATHILFLDLDEYLTSRVRGNQITSLIASQPEADVFSFLWYLEYWDGGKQIFSNPITSNKFGIRNNHVKSLIKVSPNVKSCKTHNAEFKKKFTPANFLSDTNIRLIGKQNAFNRRQLVSDELLESLDKETIEGWYVFHCVYRSQTEYLASLVRGRGHTGSQATIKDNRWGLCNPSGTIMKLNRPRLEIRYRINFYIFLVKTRLHNEINKARKHLIQRRILLDELLKIHPNLIDEYPRPFQGTQYQDKA